MFCANCGTKQNEGEKFCPNCGTRFEEPLKVEEVKAKEVIKPESSEPKENVSPKKKTTVQSKKETPKRTKGTKTNKMNDKASETELEDTSFKANYSNSQNVKNKDNTVIVEKDKSISIQNNDITHNVPKTPIEPSKVESLKDVMEKAKIISEIIESLKRKDCYDDITTYSGKQQPSCESSFKSLDTISNDTTTVDYSSQPAIIQENDLAHSFKDIKEGERTDVESILRLAIRYELGLGIPVDDNKANELYKRVKKECLVRNFYIQNSLNIRTGVISDAIQFNYRTIFDSVNKRKIEKEEEKRKSEEADRRRREENRRHAEEWERLQKERKEREIAELIKAEKQRLIKEMYSYHKSWKRLRFKLYINATKEQVNQLNKKINKYNNEIKGLNYDKIRYDKVKGLVEGCFEKIYTDKNIGFIRSFFISEMDKQRELTLEGLFIEVADFCETIKIKL